MIGKMNEKVKGLVIGVVVLGALGGTLGILKLTGADKVPADDSSSSKAATTRWTKAYSLWT